MQRLTTAIAFFLAALVTAGTASAETSQVRISRGFGIHYLPIYVIEEQKLLQKHAAAQGLGEVKPEFLLVDGGNHINDAVLAGAVDIGSTGTGGFLTLWAKASGTSKQVIGLGGSAAGGMVMTSRNPALTSVRDVKPTDRIAVPGVKTSLGAIILEMAVAKEFGAAEYARFDHQTVGLSYPDAVAAMISGKGEITAHVASAPFYAIELAQPGIHQVFSSVDLFGHMTVIMTFTTVEFRDKNPKLTKAFIDALAEATDFVDKHHVEAARIYAKFAKVKSPESETVKIISDPNNKFTMTPYGVMTFANFLSEVGSIKKKPARWQDVFVPDVHNLPGT
ncbi:MAG: ABC transporter substrate-binding protein [Proteobacteria bacterium]|nr:ABC transporter substrate-binding protein [Pseudomonadota bacterium]